MIEINLTPKERQKSITKIAGIDLSLIQVRPLLISLAFLFFYDFGIDMFFNSQIEGNNKKSDMLAQTIRRKSNDLRQYDQIKIQVKELSAKEANLIKRISVIKAIVDKRSNPFQILKYIADNTPPGVWIDELVIENGILSISGYSKDFKGIYDFMDNLKNSIFISGEVAYSAPDPEQVEINNTIVEAFKVKTNINFGQ